MAELPKVCALHRDRPSNMAPPLWCWDCGSLRLQHRAKRAEALAKERLQALREAEAEIGRLRERLAEVEPPRDWRDVVRDFPQNHLDEMIRNR